jgi:phage FluMu gp28-like protein
MPFKLYPYQQKWINDTSRMKLALKARQIGFTTALCFEALKTATEKRCNILILSTSERQSYEVMDRIHSLLAVFKKYAKLGLQRESRSEIVFPNRSKITSLPASPTTVRGYSGHVFLDEFAFHRDAKAIWTSMLPTISKGYSVRVISTPAGKSGKFYELWESEDMGFSKHKIDIYQAAKDGCNTDIELFRKSMDADSFAQEFECVFVDEAWSYFPMEMIQSAVSAECDAWDGILKGQVYFGVDIGRKKDLTVIIAVEKIHPPISPLDKGGIEGGFYVREIKTLQGKTFAEQRQAIEDMKETLHPLRICIDASGLGMQLAEDLRQKYSSAVEPVGFTSQVKEELVTKSRILFEKGQIKIPQDMDLIRDIHSIKKTVTVAGNVRFDADRTDKGHADRFWAMALSIHAGMRPAGMPYVASRSRREAIELTKGF